MCVFDAGPAYQRSHSTRNGVEPMLADINDSPALSYGSDTSSPEGRWSADRARDWMQRQGWICGFNFLPSCAVNFIDMWHPATFDAAVIDRELDWAADIGFNALRTNLQFLLWQDDAAGYRDRIDRFLDISARHGLRTVFCLFDDCGFSGGRPQIGIQSDPVPGVHNSRAMASPGREIVMDMAARPQLEAYVSDIVTRYAADERILFWDLYNEPGNLMIFRADGHREFSDELEPYSHDLLRQAFDWARACEPVQPLTSGAWHLPMPWNEHDTGIYTHPIDQTAFVLSDIVSFHAYCEAHMMTAIINKLGEHGRPVMCTEWLARNIGSRIEEQLPLFREHNVGAFQWGLVRGRTQTHIPWPGVIGLLDDYDPQNAEWFHDVLDGDGKAYDPAEIELIGRLAKAG
jgi:hypothetical protein